METWEFRTWKHGFLHFLYGHHNGRQKLNIRFIGDGPLDFLETWIEVGLYGHHMRLNTRFQTRLNALYTDDYVVIRLRDTRSVADSSLVHSSVDIPPHFFDLLTIVNFHIF
jgi:hypothetical protein